jgi:hypothetical protein
MAKTFPTLFGDKIKSGTQLDVNVKSISFNTNTLLKNKSICQIL